METDWRSRDLYGAWYENVIGMVGIGLLVGESLKDYFGLNLKDKLFYVDRCNSLHVYENRYKEFKKDADTFKRREPRNWNSKDSFLIKMWEGELFSPVYEFKNQILDPVFKNRIQK
jgi:thymidylate synthase